ncbi:hypothetical protein BO85DRAFT_467712 [Aspergillus piperis CBS 112811]|uniref:FAD-binding domain-containing protein n=1 Tax=Aspergillus piperis CBS 112811 TaxID=1448313 RepID=A0A8G1R3T2_9EURO|nr:hypothetical protein BO85DRAFT_467712 [Aspergillus piperis CBS 112811]RAH58944.1 hypothetical protein BO85DRAFT_467712 [Aspergillus piperis CBS 112811]
MSPTKEDIHFDDDAPILIVGGGPCGLLLAYLLAQLGRYGVNTLDDVIRSLLCERYPTRLQRGEVFWVNFITSLSGRQVGRLPYERIDPEVLESILMMIYNISQPEFEELVAKRLSKNNLVEIRKNHLFVGLVDVSYLGGYNNN